MPFPSFGQSPLKKPATPTVKLTSMGNQKMLAMMPQGFEYQVMQTTKNLEPCCSAEEVAKDLHWDVNKVQGIMESLYAKGWIERAN